MQTENKKKHNKVKSNFLSSSSSSDNDNRRRHDRKKDKRNRDSGDEKIVPGKEEQVLENFFFKDAIGNGKTEGNAKQSLKDKLSLSGILSKKL
jgi:hypothetical protein